MTGFRNGPDGEVICPHRDRSCCPACLAADPQLVNVLGAVYRITDPAELAQLADLLDEPRPGARS